MKIAIACNGNNVSLHFGHCEQFMIYDVEDNQVVSNEMVANPGHEPGFLPVFLKQRGVNVVIAGGMGSRAQNLFAQNSIEAFVGAEGDCQRVIEAYLRGELVSTGNYCDH